MNEAKVWAHEQAVAHGLPASFELHLVCAYLAGVQAGLREGQAIFDVYFAPKAVQA